MDIHKSMYIVLQWKVAGQMDVYSSAQEVV